MIEDIQKWEKNLSVRIPLQTEKKLNLHPGSSIMENIQASQYDLEIMLKEITTENHHHQMFDDEHFGNEES